MQVRVLHGTLPFMDTLDAKLYRRLLHESMAVPDEYSSIGECLFAPHLETVLDDVQNSLAAHPVIVDQRVLTTRSSLTDWVGLTVPFSSFYVETWMPYDNGHGCGHHVGFECFYTGQSPLLIVKAFVNWDAPTFIGMADLYLKPDGSLDLRYFSALFKKNDSPRMIALVNRLCDTLAFLGCRNIGLTTCPHIASTQKRLRKIRKSQPASFSYHVLTVRHKAVNANHASNGEAVGRMPLHMCRGHRKFYTPDKPLFGKYSGWFFVPAHARGSVENGVRVKDYRVPANI